MKVQKLGANGTVACGLIQPELGPSTRRRRAAYGVLLGCVALDKGSDPNCFSQHCRDPFPYLREGRDLHGPSGLELADSCFGGETAPSYFLSWSTGFHLVEALLPAWVSM